MQIIKKHIEKLDAHVQKHAPKLHEHAKRVHAHLSKPAKHHHYWLALCGIILRSSIVTYTNSSFARQSLQDQFIRPTKSDLMILEPIDTINTLNPRSNLTGLYTGGDIIITALSFKHANLTPQNTIFANNNENAVYVDITFKNNGPSPLYIPLVNQPNNYGDYNIICYTNGGSGGHPVRINKSLLQQSNYLLPGASVPGTFKMQKNIHFSEYAPNGYFLKCVAVSQAQQGWNPRQPSSYQSMMFEINGQNNEFSINYTYNNPTNSTPVCSNQLVYAYTQTANIGRGSSQSTRNRINSLPSCSCDINALDTTSPHDCQFNGQRMNIQYPNITWPINNAYWFTGSNVGPFCTDNHNAADSGVDVYLSILGTGNIPTCNQTGGNNTGINGFDLTITDITSTYNNSTNKIRYNFKLKNLGNQDYDTGTPNTNAASIVIHRKDNNTIPFEVGIQGYYISQGGNLPSYDYCNYGGVDICNSGYSAISIPVGFLSPLGAYQDTINASLDVRVAKGYSGETLPNGTYTTCHTFDVGSPQLIFPQSSNILPQDINISNNSTQHCTTFTKGNNNGNGYGYGYGYGYTNGYGYGYGYGYRYAKGQYANSPIFYLTKPYLMISQSVWEQYKNINLLPTKMKKLAAGTIEKLFDKKALIEMANELQTSFDRTKQKLETMKTAVRSKVQSDYQKARKLFEDGYTALFKKKGLRNKETEQAIKKTSKSESTLTTQVLPSETIKSKTNTTKQPATANASQSVQDQAIKAPVTTKKDGLLKRIKDKMRQLIKDKIKQVKSN